MLPKNTKILKEKKFKQNIALLFFPLLPFIFLFIFFYKKFWGAF